MAFSSARVCLCCCFILFVKEKETWPASSKDFEALARQLSQELLGLAVPLQPLFVALQRTDVSVWPLIPQLLTWGRGTSDTHEEVDGLGPGS